MFLVFKQFLMLLIFQKYLNSNRIRSLKPQKLLTKDVIDF